ncbi:ATP-binding protein [Halobacteriovorax sp. HLS]|uniref:ATP-binding protein n=1 Tax=Halobacteriovorax sp. HLS TaxID=2234000 RepID=UPI000FD6C079|nr:ATP-binding protein [Halobacteriovorax sp. HLS]
MKLYLILIFTAISMAFATGYVSLLLKGTYTSTADDILDITKLKLSFQKSVAPKTIVNFNSLYYSPEQFQLIDPIYTLPEPGSDKSVQYYSSDDCFKGLNTLINRVNFEKVWIWEEYRCGKLDSLPAQFFKNAPYVHPSGKSYAYLAFLLNKNYNKTRGWALEHLQFFHITELSSVDESIGDLGSKFSFLGQLDSDTLRRISTGQGTILTEDYLLARIKYPSFFSILEYRFYAREDLEGFLKDSPYFLHNYRFGRNCFYKDGQLCWEYRVGHILTIANKGTVIFLFGLVFICIIVVRLLIIRIKNQKHEDEKRRLALRILGHEFRTPITSMLLLVEKLNKRFDKMDPEVQDTFLRISGEVYRLQRLTETSRHYLKANKGKKLIHMNPEKISSMNDFLYDIALPFIDLHGDDIVLELPEEDFEFVLDSYWVSILLKNLLNNAFFHGKPPVVFKVVQIKDSIEFSIIDQGEVQFDSWGVMSEEFAKGNKSSGTGLGLNIVKQVVKEMGSEIQFSKNPTTFKFILKKIKVTRGDSEL